MLDIGDPGVSQHLCAIVIHKAVEKGIEIDAESNQGNNEDWEKSGGLIAATEYVPA
jgi:hypothetical protein